MDEYRIVWKSRITGCMGRGDWLSYPNPPDTSELNAEYPDIDHWVERRPMKCSSVQSNATKERETNKTSSNTQQKQHNETKRP